MFLVETSLRTADGQPLGNTVAGNDVWAIKEKAEDEELNLQDEATLPTGTGGETTSDLRHLSEEEQKA